MALRDPLGRGNLACWHELFNFDYCCGAQYGDAGNADCWDSVYSFDRCCLAITAGAICWQEARSFIETSGDPVAEHPALADDGVLARFCCHPTEFTSRICWGAGREDGSPFVRDSVNNVQLNFTVRYAQCCLHELGQALEDPTPPAWVSDQLNHDFATWMGRDRPFSLEELDAFEASMEASGRGEKFCRFRVRSWGIFHCDFDRTKYFELLGTMRTALHVLQATAFLPDLDFFLYVDEAFGLAPVGDAEAVATWSELANVSVPVLVQAKVEGLPGVLVPWWAYLQLDWTALYRGRLMKASEQTPWEQRHPTLFWRGSDTGCILPNDACGSANGGRVGFCSCADWDGLTWTSFPRSRLVLASMLMPRRINARYTKDVVHRVAATAYDTAGLWVDQIVPPEAHVDYRYLMYVDGTSFSDRLYWLMLSGSTIFRASSRLRVWLDAVLRPWEHYVPVREDLTDLVDRLDWAREHEMQAVAIGENGSNTASEMLSIEANLFYLYHVLLRIAAGIEGGDALEGMLVARFSEHMRKQETSILTSRSPERQRVPMFSGEASSLECWVFGITPELCCNVAQFGPGGNANCWEGDFTFVACCVGRLADLAFWSSRESTEMAAASVTA
eukprot:TRINITY_DN55875_c0_g1_i1.p1 TRINITY_DN55875_c0_g1~~TRINITY_DN55875_c0_g1_i1.p1  ORF type:complete len:617 (+),score=93.51 TRINITY_DN55875_c0_g1_i1:150-2000(+)